MKSTLIKKCLHMPTKINFTQMMTFIQAAESQSITQAAQHLSISSAAVSKQIKLLESSIGQELLYRNAHFLALTEV